MPRRVLERLALALFLVLLILTAWIGDDAYITFRTVENASAGHGLRWNVAERVQAFTHPLWCLLLLVARPLATPYWAAMALSSACSAAAFVAVLRLAPSSGAVLVAAATLLSSMAFVHFSTSGLENPVLHLLLALFATVWLDERRPPWRTFALFLLSALLAMTRLDCLLLVAPALASHLWRERQRGWRAAAAAGLLPIVAWEAFALVYYGFPFPNTAYAKLQTGVSGWDLARQGVEYVRACAEREPVTIVALAAGRLAAGRRAAADRALAIGLLGYVMFVIRVGGDFMLGRFFSGPLVVAVVLATRACGTWSTRASTAAAAAAGALGLLAVEPTLTVVRGHHVVPSRGRNGIAVERSYYAPATGLAQVYLGRQVPDFPWADAGRAARRRATPVVSRVGVGFFAYEAGPAVHVIDEHGLGDPLLARLPARLPPWRIGHFRRRVPDGYVETIEERRNALAEPSLAEYYDRLALLTRAPLLAPGRLQAIVRFNLRRYDPLIVASSYGPRTIAAAALATRVPDGTPWDAPGHQILLEGGLLVRLPVPTRVQRLEISVDANDDYRIELWGPRGAIAGQTIRRRPHLTGTTTHDVRISSGARLVEEVSIRGGTGDRQCAVAFLSVE